METIKAKYKSTCPHCNGAVKKGDEMAKAPVVLKGKRKSGQMFVHYPACYNEVLLGAESQGDPAHLDHQPAPKPAAGSSKASLIEALLEGDGLTAEETRAVVVEELERLAPRRIEIVALDGSTKPLTDTTHEQFETVLELAQARQNIFLVGPSGSGKTTLARQVAEALDLPFSANSCSAGMSEAQVTGWLIPKGSSGAFEYIPAEFVERYENGGVHLIDEIDNGDANMLTFLNTALSNDFFSIPQRYEDTVVKRHKDFVCISAGNTFGHGANRLYVGRNQLDTATLDRFKVGTIEMDYSKKIEDALVNPAILEWGLKVRKIVEDAQLRRLVSTRVLKDLTFMSSMFPGSDRWSTKDGWRSVVTADWSIDEKEKVSHV